MQARTAWTGGSLGACGLAGAIGGGFAHVQGQLSEGQLAGALFVAIFSGAALGSQLYRRGLGRPTFVAAACAFLAMSAFFAVPLLLREGPPPAAYELLTLLVMAPLIAGASAAGGAAFLARGVDEYRAEHGLVHAPAAGRDAGARK